MYSMTTFSRKVRAKLLSLAHNEQWVIGARARRNSQLVTGLGACTMLEPPEGMHYADPFIFEVNERTYVFFEVWGKSNPKGIIHVSTLDAAGHWSPPALALERPYHLSYPQVFSWRGDIYMLPESRHNRTIELYRSVRFPNTWECAAVLIEGVDAVDATFFEREGCWWMFTAGLGRAEDRLRHLSIFYAQSPFGPWQPHTSNPVVDDLSRARPAGSLIVIGNQLIRPAQDCRSCYGYAISWNRIDVLTESAYHETPIASLSPNIRDGWVAVHTFNQNARWQVFDGKRLVPRRNIQVPDSAF